MLEIGVMGGGSLDMWQAYLGPGTTIIGLDNDETCKVHARTGIEIVIGDQADPAILAQIVAQHPRLDIVLDDGSHRSADTIATFQALYEHVDPNGVYMVEDTHTNYWPSFDGGLKRPGTFIEFTKDKIDELNATYTSGAIPISPFTTSTSHIAVYDSIVAFERRPQGKRLASITLGMAFPDEAMRNS